jgi:hypothetical protein
VNRSITEGRRRFMEAYAEIETGAECERFAPVVSALADGSASSAQVLAIRPHLRHCTSCRAAVRDLHLSRSRRALLFFPLFAVGGSPEPPAMHEVLEVDRADLPESPRGPLGWLVEFKDAVVAFFHRLGGSDLATGVHIASATGGGGRVATLAAVIGFCVSSVGAGTVCVVAGLVPNPLEDARPDAREQRAERPRRDPIPITAGPSTPAPTPLAVEQAELVAVSAATPTPSPTPAPGRRKTSSGEAKEARRTPTPREDPAQGTTPTSQESAPISPAPPASTTGAASGQDTFTPEAPRAPVEPAAAPATGGGEFTP